MLRIALILVLMTPSWAWAENYLCLPTKITGFHFVNDKWETGVMDTGDLKYIVSIDNKSVSEFGEAEPIHTDCGMVSDIMLCTKGFGEFNMGIETLRYMRTLPYVDYLLGATGGTPNIEIGTCSKF